MANIAINNYCNHQCPYCYIDNLKDCKVRTMAFIDYCSLLEWFAHAEEEVIGITGGEPTLHPDIDKILKETDRYCRNLNATSILYTNGTYLKECFSYLTNNFYVSLSYIPDIDQNEILHILAQQEFFKRRKAGYKCVLYIDQKKYTDFWEKVEEYDIVNVEVSIAMPFGTYSKYKYDKEKYFTLMKPIFLQFCKDAIKHNREIIVNCPEIPKCYFTLEEQEIVNQACDLDSIDKTICLPIIEVAPDWTASMCFISGDERIDIRNFESMEAIERYLLLKNTYPKMCENYTGRCTSCSNSELLQCQGGCLGFADI